MTDKEKLISLVNENVKLIKHFYVDIHLNNSGDEIVNTIEHIEKIIKELYPGEVILAKEEAKEEIRKYREFGGWSNKEIENELKHIK